MNQKPKSSLTVAEAREEILSRLSPISGWESVPERDALGRVLAAPVIAPFNVPAHDNSAMDGYAVRHADLAAAGDTPLHVVGTAFGGRPFSGLVGPGQAARIMTGAEIPVGADTIVVQEVTRARRWPGSARVSKHPEGGAGRRACSATKSRPPWRPG